MTSCLYLQDKELAPTKTGEEIQLVKDLPLCGEVCNPSSLLHFQLVLLPALTRHLFSQPISSYAYQNPKTVIEPAQIKDGHPEYPHCSEG